MIDTKKVRAGWQYDETHAANVIRDLCDELDALRKPVGEVERPDEQINALVMSNFHIRVVDYILALEAENRRLRGESRFSPPVHPTPFEDYEP